MSIADKITSITGHLEDDYTALEQLGVSVEDRNIENIKDMANQIYAKFPKTSYAEGSNITLSNTLKGKLDFEDGIVGYGDTKQAILPSEYQQVEYIESSGGQYIDTGVKGNNNTRADISFRTKTVGNSQAVFGYFVGGYNKTLFLYSSGDKHYQVGYGAFQNLSDYWVDNTKYEISLSNGKIIINGTETTITKTSDFTTDENLLLFKISGSTGGGMPIQLYNFKIYNGDTLVRNFIPCYKISNNEIGLYDIVNNVFYTNAGTGTFGKGANIPNPSYPQEIEVVRGKNRLNLENCTKLGNAKRTNETSNSVELTGVGAWSNGTYIFPNFAINTDLRISLKLKSSVARTTGITIYGTNTNDTSSLTSISEDTSSLTSNTEKEYSVIFNSGNYKYICMRIWTNYSTTTLDRAILEVTEIMLLEGSQATSYLPYNTVEVVERGKNYSNLAEATYTSTGNTTAKVTSSKVIVNGTTTQGTNLLGDRLRSIGTLKKGTYVFSTFILSGSLALNGGATAIYLRNSSNQASDTLNVSGGFNISLKDKTFTLSQDTELFLQIFANASGMVFTNYEVGIQIEEGSTTTNFEEYQTPQIKQLSLGEYEFAKIGNYVDTIEYDVENDKVYKNEKIIKKAITSEMATQIIESADYGNYIVINPNVSIDMTSTTNNVMCNIAIPTSYDNRLQNVNNYRIFTNVSGNTIILRLPVGSSIDTLEEAKQLITNTNMYVIVKLATPTKTEITTTLKDQIKALYYSHSNNGTTIIEIDGQLPLIIKVRALKGE